MNTEDAINCLRSAEPVIRARGVVHLFLFGSSARGDATSQSDLDVFIDRDPSKPFGLMELAGLGRMLEGLVGTRVDIGTRNGLHPLIRADVEKNAIQVF